MAQDDYYYEIQLTNKQLVFYFMAGATGLILSFLAGVMVGRGVDTSSEVQAARNNTAVQDDRVVTEETPVQRSSPPPAESFSYPKLDQDKPRETLDKPAEPPATLRPVGVASTRPVPTQPVAEPPRATPVPPPPTTLAPTPKPTPRAAASPKPTSKPAPASAAVPAGNFTIQVGAFKDKNTAESIVSRLKKKGFAAYLLAPDGGDGLFSVRVGNYPAKGEAERVQAKLRDDEKFKPYIVSQQ